MSKENNIKKGLLSEKMRSYSVEPPEGAWENISSRLPGSNKQRYLFIALAAAASMALAIIISVNLIDRTEEMPVADTDFLKAESADEVQDEIHLERDELAAQKDQSSTIVKTGKQSRLEERVLLVMEELRDEMDDAEERVVAEIIREDQQDNRLSINEGDQDDADQLADVDEQETASQAMLDSIASQNYLDSLARLAMIDEKVIDKMEDEQGKWQIGASLSPIYSYRDASSQDFVQNLAVNSSESGKLSYSGGVQISYLSSDRLSFESGLYYSRMGLDIGDFKRFRSEMDYWVDNVTFSDNSIVSLSNSIGTISTKNEDVFVNAYAGSTADRYETLESGAMVLQDGVVNSFEQSLEYLEVPFNVKYKVINRDFKLLLIGGVSTNLLVGNSVTANTSQGKIDYGSVRDIRSVNYSGNAGLGFVYSFSGNLSLSLEPRFRYFLNSINEAVLPATRPYIIGLYTGLNYTF